MGREARKKTEDKKMVRDFYRQLPCRVGKGLINVITFIPLVVWLVFNAGFKEKKLLWSEMPGTEWKD